MTARARSIAVLTASLLFAPVVAYAEGPTAGTAPPAAQVQQAREHFQRGVKLYEEEDYRASLIEFKRAYELAPNWAVLYNVGQSHYQLREYASALATMERYVAEGGAQIPPDRRAQVDREMAELRGRVAHVTLQVNVPDADITVDDVSVGKSPLPRAEVMSAGRHKIAATKAGYTTTAKTVDIAGGDTLSIPLELAETAHAETATAAPQGKPSYVPAALAFGAGGVGVVLGSVFGIVAKQNKSSLDSECPDKSHCPQSAQSDIDSLSRNATISTIGFAVGIVGIGTGVVLLLTAKGGGDEQPPPASQQGARVEPWIGAGSAGLRGTF
jgi:hypothetical protein